MAGCTRYNIASDLRQVGGFLWVLRFPPPRYNWNIVESGVEQHNPNPILKRYFFHYYGVLILLQLPVGYDISPLKRVKFKILTTSKYRNPHVQLKDNLFLPLFNTNFISKFQKHAGKGTGHFNPLEDYRFFPPFCSWLGVLDTTLLVTCDRSVVFSGYSGFLRHDITEILLKVALNSITLTRY
jgi:hypothetical protein